jgi:hypothetical protein
MKVAKAVPSSKSTADKQTGRKKQEQMAALQVSVLTALLAPFSH